MYENNQGRQDAKCLSCRLGVSVCRHQAGWFPFNLENELHLPGDRANQDDMEGEQNHDLQEMVAAFFRPSKLYQEQLPRVEQSLNVVQT